MNRTLAGIVIAVVGVGAVGWHWFTSDPEPVQSPLPKPKPLIARPTVPKTRLPAERSQSLQSPAPKPVVARPMLPTKRLAPEGTYFLLERASVTTTSTVVGFPPGTKVLMVKQDGSTSTVTDGEYDLDIPSSQLTNDLDIAARVAKADVDAQRRIAELIANSVQAHEKQQHDEVATLEKQRERERTQPSTRGAPNPRRPKTERPR